LLKSLIEEFKKVVTNLNSIKNCYESFFNKVTDVSTQKQLRKIILPKEVDYKQFLIDIYIELDSIIKELKTEIEI